MHTYCEKDINRTMIKRQERENVYIVPFRIRSIETLINSLREERSAFGKHVCNASRAVRFVTVIRSWLAR